VPEFQGAPPHRRAATPEQNRTPPHISASASPTICSVVMVGAQPPSALRRYKFPTGELLCALHSRLCFFLNISASLIN
jgi:hypothetical protein